jgi:hypothetical protein
MFEDAGLEIERIARLHHAFRPSPSFRSRAHAPFVFARTFMMTGIERSAPTASSAKPAPRREPSLNRLPSTPAATTEP